MYLYHFGLSELPFTLTPNTQFYLPLTCHTEALQVLNTALMSGEGFIKVTGEVGTGKTLLCRKLLNELPDVFVRAYLPNPYLSPDELRWALASELDVLGEDSHEQSVLNQQQLTDRIQKRLLELHTQGKLVVLIVDEAQALPDESLEALRLLTNFETESRKLLQVVLLGQPELELRLGQPRLRQLYQRITFSYNLRAMSQDEVEQYIVHRLIVAGRRGQGLVPRRAAKAIYKASGGIPRLVNVLCHKALLLCYGRGAQQVSLKDVRGAVKDTESAQAAAKTGSKLLAAVRVLLVGIVLTGLSGALFYYLGGLL